MELFFKQPKGIEDLLAERGIFNTAWSERILARENIDIVKYMKVRFPGLSWKAMVVDIKDGASLYTPESKNSDDPAGGFPIWNKLHHKPSDLLGHVAFPEQQIWSESNRYIPDRYRPRSGQPPVVVINSPPDIATGPGQSEFFQLKEILDMRAKGVQVFVHGTRSFRLLFGAGLFDMGSIDVSQMTSKGSVVMPTGRVNEVEKLNQNELRWVHMLGYDKQDLFDWQKRAQFSIDAALWAKEHYSSDSAFKARVIHGSEAPNVDMPGAAYENAPKLKRNHAYVRGPKGSMGAGDGVACDFCSIAKYCKFYREGSVCVMPSRDMSKMAKMFKSRDSNQIIAGLGNLIELQTTRVEKGLDTEDVTEELDPIVSRELNSIFQNAERLAKLIDPKLRGTGTTVNVGVGIQNGIPGAAAIEQASPQQFIAGVVRELEANGISRDQITPDMIQSLLGAMNQKQIAEGEEVYDAEVVE